MSAIQHLLRRWGFVQLRKYGLELTSEGRILSSRPVLDDGTGARVVGWHDGDVSIWKLSPWSGSPGVGSAVTTPAEVTSVGLAVALPPAPTPAIPRETAASKPPETEAEPARPSARVISAQLAADPPVDEDDWEWTIALARARAAVEEAETARPPPTLPRSASEAAHARPAERSTPRAVMAASPLQEIEPALPRPTPRSTVIPVPALPTADASHRSRMEPVVRSAQSAASRLAKGTGPVDPSNPSANGVEASPPSRTARNGRAAAIVLEDTVTDLSVGDRTRPGVPLPATRRMPAVKADELIAATVPATDPTRPGIGLPPAARAVSLPSIKRRTVR